MALGLNPVGDVLKKAETVLADAGGTLRQVASTLGVVDERMAKADGTLEETRTLLGEVQNLLGELSGHLALVQEIPVLRQRLDEVHRAVHEGAAGG